MGYVWERGGRGDSGWHNSVNGVVCSSGQHGSEIVVTCWVWVLSRTSKWRRWDTSWICGSGAQRRGLGLLAYHFQDWNHGSIRIHLGKEYTVKKQSKREPSGTPNFKDSTEESKRVKELSEKQEIVDNPRTQEVSVLQNRRMVECEMLVRG